MKKIFLFLLILFGIGRFVFGQLPQFNLQVNDKIQHFGSTYGFTQDQQGYIWIGSFSKGLIKYDGKNFKIFRHEPEKPNSPSSNFIVSMATDHSGMIWISYFGSGLDRFDPVTNTFTHFKHTKADPNSIISDTLFNIIIDQKGRPWIGSVKGLDMYDNKSGKFIHFQPKTKETPADLEPSVFEVYEDKKGIIWFSTSNIASNTGLNKGKGGLFRLEPSSGKITFFKADPSDPSALINPNVSAIFEDSRGNFWVGTAGNGLHTFDRATGKFTRHLYEPSRPGKLSRPPIDAKDSMDAISFIKEDQAGKIWIGSYANGLNWYDPITQQTFHFGLLTAKKNNTTFEKDSSTGFKENGPVRFLIAADSTTWITSQSGNIYTVAYGRKTIPFFPNKKAVNSFYLEPNGNILWFGTDSGLVRKDLATNSIKVWIHDPKNPNSLNNNSVVAIQAEETGKIYIGTHTGGLDLFDPLTEKFTPVKPADAIKSPRMDSFHSVFIENKSYLWLGGENGLARVDRSNNNFKVWRFNKEDVKGISGSAVYSIAKDKKNNLWFANIGGLDKFISDSNYFRHYLKGYSVRAVLVDSEGILWVGTDIGLYHYNETKDQFIQFNSPVFSMGIETILNILEDNQHNLWITTANSILKLSSNREKIQMFNADYGIFSLNWNWLNNYKASDGRLFMGGGDGYYMFKPEDINVSNPAPNLNFSQLIIGSKEITPGNNGILTAPIWKTEKIKLNYNQNTFSLDFIALNYNSTDAIKYQYQLEGYDPAWNNLGTDHKASFFNVPPGDYVLKIRALNSEGSITEKSLVIVITPPWWKTWWAYCLYALLIGGTIWAYVRYRSKALRRENLVLEQKVEHRTKQLQESLESLKATQAQLVQSEKMASLGELTAGIAHEIQNPLNFVNNFSEVNQELADELEQEIDKGNLEDAKLIAKNIKDNQEKIIHHGHRADAIVKGMLQHSRKSSGQKEPTDINLLADEYLRLSYHGLRAKDKSFNATFKTDFDESIGMVNLMPQDFGRVLLNLINNAFYAVTERKILNEPGYEPTVTIATKKIGDAVEITVSDNGNGIPAAIKEKIFQPFFTTKPTGQGTGLGLSLSYDIVKAHGGDLKVNTLQNDGTAFIILLPS